MTGYPEVVVGTYEEFLLGYEIEKQSDGVCIFLYFLNPGFILFSGFQV